MTKRLVLLDGHALAYRAYFALTAGGGNSRWTTSFGEPTAGTYGFASILLRVLERDQPDYLAVAFDVGKTFRNELHPEYKGTRAKMPDDMRPQVDRMRELVDVFGFPRLEREGFEADDLLGSAAFEAAESGIDVKIITGDRDLLQLVSDRITVDLSGGKLTELKAYRPADVKAYLGVRPDQVVDYKALVGDPSDNYAGVPGIGPKTAVALLDRFETLDGVYANLEEIKGAARKKLEENRASATLSRELAQIKTDLNVVIDFNAADVTRAAYPAADKFFRMMEFRTLIPRLKAVAGDFQPQPDGQLGLFGIENASTPEGNGAKLEHCATRTIVVDDEEKLAELAGRLSKAETIGLDSETTAKNAMAAELVGLSFSVEPNVGYYIPVGHHSPDPQLSIQRVSEVLNPILANPSIRKVGHNIKYDLIVLKNHGFTVAGELFDTMIAGWVLDPGSTSLGLKAMARVILDSEMTPIEALIGKGKNQISMADVAIEAAAPYAAADADQTLQLEKPLGEALDGRNAAGLYRTLETPLIPVLVEMERNGIRVDVSALSDLSRVFSARLIEIENAIYDCVGYSFNINSTQQLSVALFQDLKLDPPPSAKKTTAGLYSTAADVLEEMTGTHEVIELILENREIAKLKSTYVDALPLEVVPGTGRIHTSFNQTGTVTGRLASSSPNLQNIPTRTELGRKVRSAFVPAEGWTLLSVDYSQIELRIIAHLSQDENMLAAFRAGQDIHAATAAAIYGVPLSDVTKDMRRHAKAINFGLIYGMSSFGLSRSTNLSRQDASAFVRIYFTQFPRINAYLEGLKAQAAEQGFVETMMGRRRYFPNLKTEMNRNLRAREEREAINAPIQGSAADIMKKAMIDLAQRLKGSRLEARLILQVHDELMLECPPAELEDTRRLVQETMENAVSISIPLTTEARSGPNWGALEALGN